MLNKIANSGVRIPQWLNLYRRYPHWNRAGCIFIHIPKVAGTTINHALYGRTLGHYTIREVRSAFPRLVERCFVFSVVRNPLSRLYSAYRFAKAGSTADMAIHEPSKYRIKEFETFERFIREWLVYQDLSACDHVFRPQYTYICVDGSVAVDFVGKIEHLDRDIAVVEKRVSRKIALATRNALPGGLDEIRGLSDGTRSLIFDIYRRDFEIFGYDVRIEKRTLEH